MVGPQAGTTSTRVVRHAARPWVLRRCAAVKLRDAPDVPSPGRPDGPVPGGLQRLEPSTRMSAPSQDGWAIPAPRTGHARAARWVIAYARGRAVTQDRACPDRAAAPAAPGRPPAPPPPP